MQRWVRIFLALALVGVAAVPWRPQPAMACFCIQPPPQEMVLPSSVVFRGKIVDIGSSDAGAVRYRFEPTVVWQGELPDPLNVYDVGGDCAAPVERGGDYLVSIGADQHGDLRIGLCHFVRALSPGPLPDDLAFLGPGQQVTPENREAPPLRIDGSGAGLQDDWRKLALLAAASLAAAGVVFVVARRR